MPQLKLNMKWFKENVLIFLDMDQVILGYHYTQTGLTYGPLNEIVDGLCYLCRIFNIALITVTSSKLTTREAIRKEYDRHSPMWELAKYVAGTLSDKSSDKSRGFRIFEFLDECWDDPDHSYSNIPRDRLWILDDSYAEYQMVENWKWLEKRLISRRDRLTYHELAFIEKSLRNDSGWNPFSYLDDDPRYLNKND